MSTLKNLQDISVTLGTKMALNLDSQTLDQTRRTLGWSQMRLAQFMAGEYDLKYSELEIMAKCVNLKPEDMFYD